MNLIAKLIIKITLVSLMMLNFGCSKKTAKATKQTMSSNTSPAPNSPTTNPAVAKRHFDGQVDLNANGYVFKASIEDSQEAINQNSSEKFIFQGEVYE